MDQRQKRKQTIRVWNYLILLSVGICLLLCGCNEASQAHDEQENADQVQNETKPVQVTENVDWSGYFDGMNGAAVVYNPADNRYMIYNAALAEVQRSPCSTFKIISALIGMEQGIIPAGDTTRPWSGEEFWNTEWNKDIDFEQAFQVSCIWYFREVVDALGRDVMQTELNRLQYGNCDISDWEGRLNNNNNNRALTGFWVESSLKISAKEQVDVMERIFGEKTTCAPETLARLSQAMLMKDQGSAPNTIYGKTGMGKTSGVVVDAWYTGFTDTPNGRLFFCVYLGESDGKNVTSAKAKEIAVQIVND